MLIDTKIINCGTAAVDFADDRGMSSVRAVISQPGVRDTTGATMAGTGLGWLGTPSGTTQVEITSGLGDTSRNLVVRPAFDLRAQGDPHPPGADSLRVFARNWGGKMQLCAAFPGGAIKVIATEP